MAVEEVVAQARDGDVRQIARLISAIEDGGAPGRAVLQELARIPGRAHVIGITGAPGVGKSTATSALITALREIGRAHV